MWVDSLDGVAMRDLDVSFACDEGKIIRLATVGQISFIRGRKLVSFWDRAGRISMRIERRERRR